MWQEIELCRNRVNRKVMINEARLTIDVVT
jgi:hypothetical protein